MNQLQLDLQPRLTVPAALKPLAQAADQLSVLPKCKIATDRLWFIIRTEQLRSEVRP